MFTKNSIKGKNWIIKEFSLCKNQAESEKKETTGSYRVNTNMVAINPTRSIIILNLNGLSTSIKRLLLMDWMQKPTWCYITDNFKI